MGSLCKTVVRALHEPLQPGKRLVPLRGDLVQALAGGEQRPWFELPYVLAAHMGAVSETGLSKNVQVLRDRLARHAAARRQPCDRQRSLGAEPGDDPEAGFVTQSREDGSRRSQLLRLNH